MPPIVMFATVLLPVLIALSIVFPKLEEASAADAKTMTVDGAVEEVNSHVERDQRVLSDAVEICHDGIVYLVYSPGNREELLTAKIDSADRLPQKCESASLAQ